jgi:hypothetical protein
MKLIYFYEYGIKNKKGIINYSTLDVWSNNHVVQTVFFHSKTINFDPDKKKLNGFIFDDGIIEISHNW